MIELAHLPAINAMLNSVAFVLLVVGQRLIRRGNVIAHRRCMMSAFAVSTLFLMTYLTYRFLGEDKKFGGTGWIRPVYFFILITHVSLAIFVPILGTWSLVLGLKGRYDAHRRVARVTFPIWVYVSVTGVLVYLLLFQIYGPRT
jgi:uncharacterized membrane protein YozB (DUF420 family)